MDTETEEEASRIFFSRYWKVLVKYPHFRCLILVYLCTSVGDSLSNLANLVVLQRWNGTGTALSHWAIVSLLPKLFATPVGGVLADRLDKRHFMVTLDLMSGVAVLGSLPVLVGKHQSLAGLYVIRFVRSALASMYSPAVRSILRLVVSDDGDMQSAVTIYEWAFAAFSVVSGLAGGPVVAWLGIGPCYWIDSATYFLSCAILYWGMRGTNYSSVAAHNTITREQEIPETTRTLETFEEESKEPPDEYTDDLEEIAQHTTPQEGTSLWSSVVGDVQSTWYYLSSCGCTMLLTMKAFTAALWGVEDVVGVMGATVRNADGSEDVETTSFRLGIYICVRGLGPITGLAVFNIISRVEVPATLQRACVWGFAMAGCGWLLSSTPSFVGFLLGTGIRFFGEAAPMSYSNILLQVLIDKAQLGRVIAIESVLATLAEVTAASATGKLFDKWHFSKRKLCLWAAGLSFGSTVVWAVYHWAGLGAARPRFNPSIGRNSYSSQLQHEPPDLDEEDESGDTVLEEDQQGIRLQTTDNGDDSAA